MTIQQFIEILRIAASADTSADPNGWTESNPLWGHCAVASLLVQDYFGGTLMRGSLENSDAYKHLRSHFWNLLPQGEIDVTAEQYPDLTFNDLPKEPRERERVLSHPDTLRRYELLKTRFEERLKPEV